MCATLSFLSYDTEFNNIIIFLGIGNNQSNVFPSTIAPQIRLIRPSYVTVTCQFLARYDSVGYVPLTVSMICNTCTNETVTLQAYDIFSIANL
jgi:hypothetical protein